MELQNPNQLIQLLDEKKYVTDEELVTALFLLMKLNKPLLLEGPPGVGKTETAIVLAGLLNTKLIGLQYYQVLDVNAAVYEWNYQKQLLGKNFRKIQDLPLKKKNIIFSATIIY